MSLANKRILVTGGAGFIGSHLAKRLAADGAKVRVADNLCRGRLSNLAPVQGQIEFMKEDLTRAEACARVCAGMEIVFHLASKVGGIGYYMQKPGEVYTNNVMMDTQMQIAARELGVKRYLFSSSAHVYPKRLQADENSAPLKEADAYPADPAISYGWAKLVTERLIHYQNQEGSAVRTAVVRIVGAFGENQDIDLSTASAIPAFCRRALEFPGKSPFTMFGEGRETRSYVYVGDVVEGMIRCVEALADRPVIEPMNLGNEGRITIGELARMIVAVSGKPITIKSLPAAESGIRGQAVDCTLSREILSGWTPAVSLRDGILKTYQNIEARLRAGEN